MTDLRWVAIGVCVALCSLATQGHALDSLPKQEPENTLFYDMCADSAPADGAEDTASTDSSSENQATPAVGG